MYQLLQHVTINKKKRKIQRLEVKQNMKTRERLLENKLKGE